MPIYTYHCANCKQTADYLVPTMGSTPAACNSCGEDGKLERVLHGQTVSAPSRSSNSSANSERKPKGMEAHIKIIIGTDCHACHDHICKNIEQITKRQKEVSASPFN